jgi:hypothetical protein
MVASNLEHEQNKDRQGLSAEELVGNVCEFVIIWRFIFWRRQLTDRDHDCRW